MCNIWYLELYALFIIFWSLSRNVFISLLILEKNPEKLDCNFIFMVFTNFAHYLLLSHSTLDFLNWSVG